jgi:uncharacterized Zn finger protein (UPF0148 family)
LLADHDVPLMSEDFDREAEKERLREKLEGDQESRKATEHMSDLLLKGATMTNRHCDACGDPIFRYDGQEFCPTCGEAVEGEEGTSAGSRRAETDDAGSETMDAAGGAIDDGASTDAGTTDAGPAPTRHEGTAGERERSTGTRTSSGRPTRGQAERDAGRTPDASPPTRSAGGDLGEARASLVRTLSDLAARAEDAGDARRARDLLAAAHEAAEAIAAVDRADR